jgi:hypothetical protein
MKVFILLLALCAIGCDGVGARPTPGERWHKCMVDLHGTPYWASEGASTLATHPGTRLGCRYAEVCYGR